ncbi:hypothetical protein N7G274_007017 [Stereocaulon virgatum]|uniref:Uncharacterized protein n=1 Tax=Stereocaulon virgatum TaxID=373712 RepID=A0ABR4A5S2_9LECA
MHIGYPQFFNADDDSIWCNDQTFGKVGISGLSPPKLTLELRRKLNQLSDDLNTRLYLTLISYSNNRLNYSDRYTVVKNGWLRQRAWFLNPDWHRLSFAGHRSCEIGNEDPQFGGATTWIFGVWGPQKDVGPDDGNTARSVDAEVGAEAFAHIDAASCGQDPNYAYDQAFAWGCDMAGYYADPSTKHSVTTVPGLDFTRSFHPKTRSFTAIKDFVHRSMRAVRQVPPVGICIANVNPDVGFYTDPNASDAHDASAGNNTGPNTSAIPTLPSGFPASLCATASGVNGFDTTLGQPTTTATAAAPDPTCPSTGDPLTGGCQCSDGTTPPRDENDRCCLYHQPGSNPSICWNQDGSVN